MTKLIAVLIVFFSLNTFADANLGQKVEISTSGGQTRLGVQMMTGMVMVTMSVNGRQISNKQAITHINARFVNKETGEPISEWINVLKSSDSLYLVDDYALAFESAGPEANRVATGLRQSVLLLQVLNQGAPVFDGFIDMSSYCNSNAAQFGNIETGALGCPK